MIILALDTSTRIGSAAVLRDGEVLAQVPGDPARTHAERLPEDLMRALARAGAALADVDVFAVAAGPGSFTGLRVGIATMQGLSLAAGRPLVGVSVLDALAHAAVAAGGGSVPIAAWVDAWRGEVYAALYDGMREIEAMSVERPERVLERRRGAATLFIGDGAAAHRAAIAERSGPDGLFAPDLEPPLAGVIGQIARGEIDAGRRPGPADIQPLYVRRSDAELARDARGQR